MPERFTERARQVMALANQEAHHLHHPYLSSEHILLGIIQEGHGIAASVIKSLGIELLALRKQIEKTLTRGTDQANIGKLPQTPETRKVIEHAIEQARQLHHNYVGTEHLLLGLLLEPNSTAAQALTQLGAGLSAVRQEMENLTGPEAADPTDTSGQLIRRAVECLLRARDVAGTEGNAARVAELQDLISNVGAILTRRPDLADVQPG